MRTSDNHIGRRLREVRSWRRLSMIERGPRPVTGRAVLGAFPDARQVVPTELTGSPFAPTDVTDADAEAHAALYTAGGFC
ncbi:hypothetical protein [Saccharothrix sp. Mg75]|uniref:hypothetical protein n=1 Tax=Saccharothrix sp. Mg75 TaxID=3445357 RepID=UPI003EE9C228